MRRGPEAVIAAAALVVAAAVGAIVAWAVVPVQSTSAEASATPADAGRIAQLEADVTRADELLDAAQSYALSGALEELTVALVVGPGVSPETEEAARTSLAQSGAVVESALLLDDAWWAPERVAYRTEIADQVQDSVLGAEGTTPEQVLHHALWQVLLDGAPPRGADTSGVGGDEQSAGATGEGTPGQPADELAADRVAVLTEVLQRAELMSVDGATTPDVDAVVIVVPAGPEGAGGVVQRFADLATEYVEAVVVIVDGVGADAGEPAASPAAGTPSAVTPAAAATVAEAISARGDGAEAASIVVWDGDRLDALQAISAVREQWGGGSGVYGAGPEPQLLPGR